ncbi:hypothetical protein [Zobellia alginiliquefaciens]|uniref:hypothetical protein n=1 Tax=Zobellia alginiliquefaciens TaxID=3032586 RepID=UPI0023E17598|nr:hypothetical protein [Zobellia alginiliquefaciens]
MRIKTTLLLSICLCIMTGCKKDNILELPITYHKGFSPFEASTGGAGLYIDDKYFKDKINPWKKTHLKVSGVPQNWTDAKVGHIQSDMERYVYQNYLLGDMSKEWYEQLQDMWN